MVSEIFSCQQLEWKFWRFLWRFRTEMIGIGSGNEFYVFFAFVSGNKTEIPQGCSGKIRWVVDFCDTYFFFLEVVSEVVENSDEPWQLTRRVKCEWNRKCLKNHFLFILLRFHGSSLFLFCLFLEGQLYVRVYVSVCVYGFLSIPLILWLYSIFSREIYLCLD